MTIQSKVFIAALTFVLTAASVAQEAPPAAGTPGAPQAQAPGAGEMAILNMKAGEIEGREVYNAEGKSLGKVDMVGRDRDTGNLNAIVSVGGFLGLGGDKVAIPIEQLTLKDNKLSASISLSKDELRKESANFKEKKYESVAKETTLSQVAPARAAGAAPGGATKPPQATMSFQRLDTNTDGYISQDEARSNQTLTSRWATVDKNSDGKLDPSEFSAFEETLMRPETRDQLRSRDGYRNNGSAPPTAPGAQPQSPSGATPPPAR